MAYILAPFNPTNPYQNQVATELNIANNNFTILGQAFYNNDPTSQPILRASYTGSTAPSNPVAGTTWLDTSTSPSVLKVYDGNNWQYTAPLNSSGVLDLSTTYVKSSVYTFRRINGNNLTSDYTLSVGEEAIYTFSTSSPPINIPLHIATDSHGLYLVLIFDYMTSQPSSDLGHYYLNVNNTTYSSGFKCVFIDFSEGSSSLEFNTFTKDFLYFDKFPGGVGSVLVNIYNRVAMFESSTNIAYNGGQPGNRKIGTARWTDKSTAWTSLGTMSCNSTVGVILVRRLA